MKLSEALRLSRERRAIGYFDSLGTPLLVAEACDLTVTFTMLVIHEDGEVTDLATHDKSWSDLLPEQHEYLFGLRWESIDPKSPLEALAESLTDWQEEV